MSAGGTDMPVVDQSVDLLAAPTEYTLADWKVSSMGMMLVKCWVALLVQQ